MNSIFFRHCLLIRPTYSLFFIFKYYYNYSFLLMHPEEQIYNLRTFRSYYSSTHTKFSIQQPFNQNEQNIVFQKQQYKSQYQAFFNEIINQQLPYISQQSLKKHRITLIQNHPFRLDYYDQPFINVMYTQNQAKFVVYNLLIGKFKLEIILLNINKKSENVKRNIGKGSFGEVRIEMIMNKQFVVKRQYFSSKQNQRFKMLANKKQLQQIIIQFALYKICSLYRIGPAIDTQIGFDIICYNNCTQFHLELCNRLIGNQNYQELQRNIKFCLYHFHQLRIIHRDIKPDNILYSNTYQRYVLSDFGLSYFVKQFIGQLSHTYFQGTYQYMCQQMKNLSSIGQGFINMYENDRFGLEQSLKEIKQKIQQTKLGMHNFQEGSMVKTNKNQSIEYINNNQYLVLKLIFFIIKRFQEDHFPEFIKILDQLDQSQLQRILEIIQLQIIQKYQRNILDCFQKSKRYQDYETIRQKIINMKSQPTFLQKQICSEDKIRNYIRVYGLSYQVLELCKMMNNQTNEKLIKQIQENIYNQIWEYTKKNLLTYQMIGDHIGLKKKIKYNLIYNQKKYQTKSILQLCVTYLNYQQDKTGDFILNILKSIQLNNQLDNYLRDYYLIVEQLKYDDTRQKLIKLNKIFKKLQNYLYHNQSLPESNYQVISITINYIKILLKYFRIKEVKNQIQQLKIYAIGSNQHDILSEYYYLKALIQTHLEDFQKAVEYFNKSEGQARKIFPQQHFRISKIYCERANIYFKARLYKKSHEQINKCIKINSRLFGNQSYEVASNYLIVSRIYDEYQNIMMSNLFLQKYIDIVTYTSNNMNFIKCYEQICKEYIRRSDLKNALLYAQKQFQIIINKEEGEYIMRNHSIMIQIYSRMKNFKQAQQLSSAIIKIFNKTKKKLDKMAQIRLLTIICDCLHILRHYQLSIQYTNIVLKQIYEEFYHQIIRLYMLIGLNYKNLNQFDQCQYYYSVALQLNIQNYSKQIHSLAWIYQCFGQLYYQTMRLRESKSIYQKSISIYIKLYGEQTIEVAKCYKQISKIFDIKGYFDQYKAQIYLNKSYQIYLKCYGQKNIKILLVMKQFAYLYRKILNVQQTFKFLNKYLEKSKQFLGQNCESTADAYKSLAQIQYFINSYKKSYQHILKSITIKNQLGIKLNQSIIKSYLLMIENLIALNQKQNALSYSDTLQNFITKQFTNQSSYLCQVYSIQRKILVKFNKWDQLISRSKNKFISLYKKCSDYNNIVQTNLHIAQIFTNRKQYVEAFRIVRQCLKFPIQVNINYQRFLKIVKSLNKVKLIFKYADKFLFQLKENDQYITFLRMAQIYLYYKAYSLSEVYLILAYYYCVKWKRLKQIQTNNMFKNTNKQFNIIQSFNLLNNGSKMEIIFYIDNKSKQKLYSQIIKIKRLLKFTDSRQKQMKFNYILALIYKKLNLENQCSRYLYYSSHSDKISEGYSQYIVCKKRSKL